MYSKRVSHGYFEGMPDSPWADPPGSEFVSGTETPTVIGQLVSAAARGEQAKFRDGSLASTLLKDPDYLTFLLRYVTGMAAKMTYKDVAKNCQHLMLFLAFRVRKSSVRWLTD